MSLRVFSSLLFSLALCLIAPVETAFSQSKIVGGNDTDPGAYPWMAAIVDSPDPDDVFFAQFCGGALIDRHWVVTAAHCVEKERASRLGVWLNIRDLDDTSEAVYRRVAAIYKHPHYSADSEDNLYNDIALLLLESPVDSVAPVEFALTPTDVGENDSVRAIGWGSLGGNRGYPTLLQEVDLNIEAIASVRSDYGNRMNSRHLAASARGKDTCQGDSGGPLFDVDGANGDPLLVGITSFGIGCAAGYAGIYANVGNYRAWIDTFLSAPTDIDPEVTVTGKGGRDISNGTRSTPRRTGAHFGRRFAVGKGKTQSFHLRNSPGTTPASVISVGASSRYFSVRAAPEYVFGGSSGRIGIRYRAGNRRRSSKGTVRIYTNDSDNPVYSFRVLGRSKGS